MEALSVERSRLRVRLLFPMIVLIAAALVACTASPRPHTLSGSGWRLIAIDRSGPHVGEQTFADQPSFEAALTELGWETKPAFGEIDFATEVVFLMDFGPGRLADFDVTSDRCTAVVLGVSSAGENSLEIRFGSDPVGPEGCTLEAHRARMAFVLERDVFGNGPFQTDPQVTDQSTTLVETTETIANDAEPVENLRPTLARSEDADFLVSSNPDYGTFHNRDGCVVFDNHFDGTSYAVAVPNERGGFLSDDGLILHVPMHRAVLDAEIDYWVGGFALDIPRVVSFVVEPGPDCPTDAFLVLETRLERGQEPVGSAMAGLVECEAADPECTVQLSYLGIIWTAASEGSGDRLAGIALLASEVGGTEEASLWSTSDPDLVLLKDAAGEEQLFQRAR